MSDLAVPGPAGEWELRLRLPGGPVPLDRVVIGLVELAAGVAGGEVNARLTLIEGDLEVTVVAAGGAAVTSGWPWPVDAGPRTATLVAGARLVAAIPLLSSRSSAPLFPVPGAYEVTARYDTGVGVISSAPVRLIRTPAADPALAASLRDRDVLQSLLGGGVLGDARAGVAQLAQSEDAATAAVAALALGVEVGRSDEAALAVAAILPPGATGPDSSREAMLRDDPEVTAALDGSVLPPG